MGIKAKHFAAMQHKLRTDLFKAHGLFGPSLRRVAAAVASVRLDGSHLWRQDPITRCWKLDEAPPAPEGEEAQQTEKKRPLATQLGHMGSTGTSYTVTDFAAMREAVHEQAEAALNEVVEVIKAETGTVGTAIVDELNAAFPNAPTERELRAAR